MDLSVWYNGRMSPKQPSRSRRRFAVSPIVLLPITGLVVVGLLAAPDVPREAYFGIAGFLALIWTPWLAFNLLHRKYSRRRE